MAEEQSYTIPWDTIPDLLQVEFLKAYHSIRVRERSGNIYNAARGFGRDAIYRVLICFKSLQGNVRHKLSLWKEVQLEDVR